MVRLFTDLGINEYHKRCTSVSERREIRKLKEKEFLTDLKKR